MQKWGARTVRNVRMFLSCYAPGGINFGRAESEIGGGGLRVNEVCTAAGCCYSVEADVVRCKKTVGWKDETCRILECMRLFR